MYIVTPKAGVLNPLKPELNPICYLLALLGAHHFLHISRIWVKLFLCHETLQNSGDTFRTLLKNMCLNA